MRKYLRVLLPLLFITYYSSVALFTHVHIEQGTTIVHAHPFASAGEEGSHHHGSLAEIQLFHQLSTIVAADGAVHFVNLPFYATLKIVLSESPVAAHYVEAVMGQLLLRAPPFEML